MRKGFTPAHFPHCRFTAFLLLTALCLSHNLSNAQTRGQRTYRDGFPLFKNVDSTLTKNVALSDTVVSLLAKPSAITDPDTFVLSGVDWPYPSNAPILFSPEDIDKIPEELESIPGPGQDFYLITDGIAGGKVYLISNNNPTIVSEFGGATNLIRPVDAFPYRASNGSFKVVITDQGGNRVMQVDWLFKTIDWQYGGAPSLLSSPADAVILSAGREVLIADAGNNRVIVVDTTSKAIVWNSTTFNNLTLSTPADVEASADLFLITDQNNHRVIIVQRSNGQIVWRFGNGKAGSSDSTLNAPTDADFLPSGNILICDKGNKRLIEIDRNTLKKVYQFAHPLTDLRDADRLAENVPDRDKTLVIAKNTPASLNALPLRLAYKSEVYESNRLNLDFSMPVDFDSLSFPLAAADVPAGTRIRLRLRSANVIADLNNAKWVGPKSELDFYTGPSTAINPVHDGHRFVQYQVFLDNNVNPPQNQVNPLLTPLLRKVKIAAHFFDTNTTGTLTSKVIRDSLTFIITNWKRLVVNSVLPANSQLRSQVPITVNIRDEANQTNLFGALLSEADSLNPFNLSLVDLLRRKQAVRLQAVFKTNNSAITPKLNDWLLEWENTKSTKSSLAFTDPNGQPVNFYRVEPIENNPPPNLGTVYLALDDINLNPVEDAVNLQVRAVLSADQQAVQLTEQPNGLFILNPGYPAVMTGVAPQRPNVIEGRSKRDTLTVSYADPTDPADRSTARVLLIQNVKGNMLIERRSGARVDSAAVNDSLFVHLTGETDRDLSTARDSLVVEFINTNISDREKLILYELANNTGEFRSRFGIPLVRSAGGLVGDSKLQVSGGEQVRIEFVDLDNSLLQQTIRVRFIPGGDPDGPIRTLAGNRAFDFFVAPNPYNAKLHNNGNDGLRFAAVANNGDILIRRIEIYNLAGERVRSLEGANVPFQSVIGRGQVATTQRGNYWWNLRNDAGAEVASGTYWAKVYLRYIDAASGATQETSAMRKFVIVQ